MSTFSHLAKEAVSVKDRLRLAWNAATGGDIGPIGWCGQHGYWWTRPCPHYHTEGMEPGKGGCHWLDIDRIRKVAVLEYQQTLPPVSSSQENPPK